jgi:hypothetical protein
MPTKSMIYVQTSPEWGQNFEAPHPVYVYIRQLENALVYEDVTDKLRALYTKLKEPEFIYHGDSK